MARTTTRMTGEVKGVMVTAAAVVVGLVVGGVAARSAWVPEWGPRDRVVEGEVGDTRTMVCGGPRFDWEWCGWKMGKAGDERLEDDDDLDE